MFVVWQCLFLTLLEEPEVIHRMNRLLLILSNPFRCAKRKRLSVMIIIKCPLLQKQMRQSDEFSHHSRRATIDARLGLLIRLLIGFLLCATAFSALVAKHVYIHK